MLKGRHIFSFMLAAGNVAIVAALNPGFPWWAYCLQFFLMLGIAEGLFALGVPMGREGEEWTVRRSLQLIAVTVVCVAVVVAVNWMLR